MPDIASSQGNGASQGKQFFMTLKQNHGSAGLISGGKNTSNTKVEGPPGTGRKKLFRRLWGDAAGKKKASERDLKTEVPKKLIKKPTGAA